MESMPKQSQLSSAEQARAGQGRAGHAMDVLPVSLHGQRGWDGHHSGKGYRVIMKHIQM